MAMILIKYSDENPISIDIFDLAKEGDEVVFIQDGVLFALGEPPKIYEVLGRRAKVYAVREDFETRGYGEEDSIVPLISYDELIEIIERNEKSIG